MLSIDFSNSWWGRSFCKGERPPMVVANCQDHGAEARACLFDKDVAYRHSRSSRLSMAFTKTMLSLTRMPATQGSSLDRRRIIGKPHSFRVGEAHRGQNPPVAGIGSACMANAHIVQQEDVMALPIEGDHF